jgi:hypothetical protein
VWIFRTGGLPELLPGYYILYEEKKQLMRGPVLTKMWETLILKPLKRAGVSALFMARIQNKRGK